MKTLKLMALIALVSCGSSAFAMLSNEAFKAMSGSQLTDYITKIDSPEKFYDFFEIEPNPSADTIFEKRKALRSRSMALSKALETYFYTKAPATPGEQKRVNKALNRARAFYWNQLVKKIERNPKVMAADVDQNANPAVPNDLQI